MEENKKIYKTFESDRASDQILESEAVANLQTASAQKIPLVQFTKIIIMAVLLSAKKEYFDAQRHVPGAAMRLQRILKELARMYYVNGEYYEKVAIESNDPSLILDLGYRYYKPRKPNNKLPIEVRNTDTPGELFGIPKLVEGSRFYIFESTIVDSIEAPKESIVGTANGEIMRGFTSGDLLMFTSQPVSMNGTRGEKTASFMIRVR